MLYFDSSFFSNLVPSTPVPQEPLQSTLPPPSESSQLLNPEPLQQGIPGLVYAPPVYTPPSYDEMPTQRMRHYPPAQPCSMAYAQNMGLQPGPQNGYYTGDGLIPTFEETITSLNFDPMQAPQPVPNQSGIIKNIVCYSHICLLCMIMSM